MESLIASTPENFYTKRRERLMNAQPYEALVRGSRDRMALSRKLIAEDLPELAADDPSYIRWSWSIASQGFELLVGRYSAGDQISEMAEDFPSVLGAVEASVLRHPTLRTEPFYLDEIDTYAYAMWLLSLCKLLRLDYLVPRVAALFDVAKEDNRGKDELFETLLSKLGVDSMPARGTYKHLKAHPHLVEAIHAEPAKRPKVMTEFLRKWYPSMKGCYWYGRHEKVPQNFFGYWAFEAGLVTYLWEIDDTSYRDLPFYPKDLVDYARTHEAVAPAAGSDASPDARPPSVRAGEPCPRTGYWLTPAAQNSRRRFQQGEVMPDTKSSYGATIWQWDENQA
jgi:hypothetical protein